MAFWGTLFKLAVSPFNWIVKVIEKVGENAGRMLSKEASHDWTIEGPTDQIQEDDTITG
jgi:hypothetical protein